MVISNTDGSTLDTIAEASPDKAADIQFINGIIATVESGEPLSWKETQKLRAYVMEQTQGYNTENVTLQLMQVKTAPTKGLEFLYGLKDAMVKRAMPKESRNLPAEGY